MKSLYNIKNHLKISLGLLVMMVSIILTSLLEKENLEEIDHNFSSMFADRLIPATDIFYIVDHLYEKRLKFQAFLLSEESGSSEEYITYLKEQNRFVDSLLDKYQKTYLVESELHRLNNLFQTWKTYKTHEENVLQLAMNGDKAKAYDMFNTTGNDLFRSITGDLQRLANIQSQVGADLMDVSKASISSTHILFGLQLVLAIVIGLVINGFLFTARVINQPNQNFHLN